MKCCTRLRNDLYISLIENATTYVPKEKYVPLLDGTYDSSVTEYQKRAYEDLGDFSARTGFYKDAIEYYKLSGSERGKKLTSFFYTLPDGLYAPDDNPYTWARGIYVETRCDLENMTINKYIIWDNYQIDGNYKGKEVYSTSIEGNKVRAEFSANNGIYKIFIFQGENIQEYVYNNDGTDLIKDDQGRQFHKISGIE